jgi:cation transport ATPase
MTLNETQIEALFTFTEKKFVKYYDLQVELVDHLANKIEELMSEDKSLTFERALGNVYEKFGIFGFAKIVSEKQNELSKNNNKQLWREIKKQFNWPNVIRSIAVFLIISTAIFSLNLETVTTAFCVLYFAGLLFFRYKNYKKAKNKKILLMTQILPSFSIGSFVYNQFLFMRLFDIYTNPIYYTTQHKIAFAFLIFIGFLILYASKSIENRTIAKAKILYPAAFA